MAGEKTEKATPKRRKDERQKGNVFFSREIVTVLSLIVVFYSLRLLGPLILGALETSITTFIGYMATYDELTMVDMRNFFVSGVITFAIAAIPVLLIAGLVAVVATIFQTRGLFSMKAASFKMSRLNPLQGLKRLFSMRGIVELLKSLIKIVILGVIIYQTFIRELMTLPKMFDMTAIQVIVNTGNIILSIVQTSAIIMAFVAGFDFLYQWWDYEKNLRMSKEELKEEYKQTEGDPQIKSQIKQRQQTMSQQRMMQQVPSADVIIRNPTHYAVAIKYDPKKNIAPVVLAKGANDVALRIISVAEANDIVITENRPLARGLFESVDLGQMIPEKYYGPVAEVLAFVYSLRKEELAYENI